MFRLRAAATRSSCRRWGPRWAARWRAPWGRTQTPCPRTSSTRPRGGPPPASPSPCSGWGARPPGPSWCRGDETWGITLLITWAHNTVHRVTNEDGRASNFLSWDDFKPGTYKMHFATSQYFKEKLTETFYPYAEVTSLFTFPCWFYWLHDATAGCIWDQGSWQPLPHSPAAQPLRILDIPRLLSPGGQSKV